MAFSIYLSIGKWQGFTIVPCKASVHIRLGYLSICLSTTDFERLFSDILRQESAYRRVKKEYVFRLEDRLIQTFEELEASEKREAELEARVLALEFELNS